ncbi:MAG: ribosome assembly cofactor RimP [Bacteroidales bacterium]|nr:ribosome assembly cofactor RimP [Bacteroidales bacterium]
MITEELIYKLVEEAIEGTDLFVVDVLVKNGDVIMIFLDADTAVVIDQCVEVSRFIESHLDRDQEDFDLRVSSSGLDHPLTMTRQLIKYIGKNLDIELNDENKLKGRLLEVSDSELKVELIVTKKLNKIKKEEAAETIVYQRDQIKTIRPVINFG